MTKRGIFQWHNDKINCPDLANKVLRREEVVDKGHGLDPQYVLGLDLFWILRPRRFRAKNELHFTGSSSQALQHLVHGVELNGHLEHGVELPKLLELVIHHLKEQKSF